jgi:uncharacterized membrane protein YphA (DoxX/SURF4 family)
MTSRPDLVGGVLRWLEKPQRVERLAMVRVVVPVAVLGFLSSRLGHAADWLSPAGFQVPYLGGNDWRQPLYLPAVPPWVAWLIAAATVLAGVCVAIGLHPRPAAGAFAVLLAYLTLADRLEAFTVTKLGPVLSIALCLSPCGVRYSVDAWRRRRREPDRIPPTHVASGALRFFQALLMVLYWGAGVAKLRGDWLSGDVLWSHLHDSYQTPFAWLLVRTVPGWLWQALQVATLIFEVGAPLWLAWRWTRTPAVLVGLTMHAMIGLMFGPVVWFAVLMGGLLVACFAPYPSSSVASSPK